MKRQINIYQGAVVKGRKVLELGQTEFKVFCALNDAALTTDQLSNVINKSTANCYMSLKKTKDKIAEISEKIIRIDDKWQLKNKYDVVRL